MQRPSALIFLSLISLGLTVSCGQKVAPSGPDPVLFQKVTEKKDKSKDALTRQLEFKLLSVRDVAEKKELPLVPLKEAADKSFYPSFKAQYKSEAPRLEAMPLQNRWFFKPNKDRYQKLLFTFQLPAASEIEWMTFELSNPYSKDQPVYLTSSGPFRQMTTVELEGSFKGQERSLLSIRVYDYQVTGEKLTFQQKLKRSLKESFVLQIEDGSSVETFLAKANSSLEEVLRKTQPGFTMDSSGMIDSINGLCNSNYHADINSYPDSAGFWRIINSKGQKLSHTPAAGVTVIIKWITMKDLRDKVAKKTRRQISGKGFEIQVEKNPQRHYWQLNRLEVSHKAREQLVDSRRGVYLENWRLKGCFYRAYSVKENSRKLLTKDLKAIAFEQNTLFEKGSILIKSGEKFVFPGRRLKVKTGFERGSCKGITSRKVGKKAVEVRMGTKASPGGDFYSYKAELVETMQL